MPDLTSATIAGRYVIQKKIAGGGMATVYLALDNRLDRQVAIKIIHPHLAQDAAFLSKFSQEAKLAARLSHPNLVNVFDQGTDGSNTYLAMEYVEGITLRDALTKFGRLTADQALDLYEQLLAGLAAAHRAGILHRDLKPENVLLADDGRVKLADFGLARSVDTQTQADSLVGTVAYLSPELVTRGQVDARSDVYAAGIMLFELVTGRQPFEGDQPVQVAIQHANSEVRAPSEIQPDVPLIIDELVLWATSRDPNQRPSDAVELLASVSQARSQLSGAAKPHARATTVLDLDADATQVLTRESAEADVTAVLNHQPLAADATQVIDSGFLSIATSAEAETQMHSISRLDRPIRWLRLLVVTILVALLGLGAGWAFGSGPLALQQTPSLTGLTLEQANAALANCNCDVFTEFENSKSVAKDRVIRSNPAAGQPLWADITLVISKGAKLIAVPDVKGMNVASATVEIVKNGLAVGKVSSWFSDEPIGTIYDFTGRDKTKVEEGSAIDLKVSLGPLPVLSNVNQTIATAALEAAGLKVEILTEQFSDTVAAGNVINFVPLTEPIGTDGKVELIVSKGPVPKVG